MFVVKVYYKNRKSPWALTLTEPVPEAFEFPASDWPQKKLCPISEEEQPGDSDLFLHEAVFLIDRHSCVAGEQNFSRRRKFQKSRYDHGYVKGKLGVVS